MSFGLGPVDPDDAAAGYPGRYGKPRRWLRYVVVIVVAAGFAGGAAVLYRGGGRQLSGLEIPLIKADDRPLKRHPEEPGGMAIPNQDKLIYNPRQSPQVERLLPPPETPLPRPAPPPAPAAEAPPPVVPAAPPSQLAAIPEPPAPIVAPAPMPVAAPPIQAAPPPPAPVPAAPPAPAPVAAAAPPPAAAPPAPSQPPQATPAKGGFRLQIGAVRSTEEAQKEWDRLKRLHADLLGSLGWSAAKADLGEKGVFYRIQAGPIATEAAASKACAELKQRKVGCILVRP